jgi:pimeloyl-ACP methyl ester carboxylesterase
MEARASIERSTEITPFGIDGVIRGEGPHSWRARRPGSSAQLTIWTKLRRHLGYGEVPVLAHSMGGFAALNDALRNARPCVRLAPVGTTPTGDPRTERRSSSGYSRTSPGGLPIAHADVGGCGEDQRGPTAGAQGSLATRGCRTAGKDRTAHLAFADQLLAACPTG